MFCTVHLRLPTEFVTRKPPEYISYHGERALQSSDVAYLERRFDLVSGIIFKHFIDRR